MSCVEDRLVKGDGLLLCIKLLFRDVFIVKSKVETTDIVLLSRVRYSTELF
jgi:hypothetical protein